MKKTNTLFTVLTISIFAIVAYVFLFSSCGGAKTEESTSTEDVTPTEEQVCTEEVPVDSSISEIKQKIEEYKIKYKYTRAKYTDYVVGDVEHFVFISNGGNELNFSGNKETAYELEKGSDINTKFKGKTFDVFYKTEVVDLGTPGPGEQEIDVIYKLILIK
jgi:hypothetical protein